MISASEKIRIEGLAKKLRHDVVEMIGVGMAGHIGGSCSSADLIAALYFYKMRYDAPNFDWDKRDRFVMSKGHSVPVQYAALVHAGILDREDYKSFKDIGCRLQGHPDHKKAPGIEANTGSLGQGLSIASGFAMAMKLDKSPSRSYVLLGDAELCEGQIWEAAMTAANLKLDNLTAMLDMNGLSATGSIADRIKTTGLQAKWEAFGWNTIKIDGHDIEQICNALDEASSALGKPSIILAKTVKGKGIPFAENKPGFHNAALTKEQYEEAMAVLS